LASAALLGAQQSRIDPAVAPIRVISFITELPARRGDAVLHGPIHGNCNKLRARATSAVKRPLIEPFCGCDSVNYLSANKIPGGFSVHLRAMTEILSVWQMAVNEINRAVKRHSGMI
jgi:hypothetical protein